MLVTVTVGGLSRVVSWSRDWTAVEHDSVGDVAVDHRVVDPVTVTVCGTFQLAGVKVRLEVETVPSVVSLELTATVTSAVGCVCSST